MELRYHPALETVRRQLSIGVIADRWIWLLPVAIVLATTRVGAGPLQLLLTMALGIGVVLVASRHPIAAFSVALIFVTFQQVTVAFLWSHGMPAELARALGGVKDALIIGVVLNAARNVRDRGWKPDAIDKLALGYIAFILVHLAIPWLFRPILPTTLGTRALAFRYDAGYVLIFLALRHADIPADARRRVRQVLYGVAAVIAAGAVYQHLAPDTWRRFIFETVRLPDYNLEVLRIHFVQVRQQFGWITDTDRAGSFLISPHEMAHILVVPFAFVIERLVRGHRRAEIGVGLLIAAALVFSKTRADAIAMILMVGLALLPRRGRTTRARIAMVFVLFAGALLVVPAILGTRFTGGEGGGESARGHIDEIEKGIDLISRRPLGTGLGNGPATADRFQLSGDRAGAFTTSNFLTQVGNELGVIALIIYVALLIVILRELARRARADPFASAAALGLVGLCTAGLYQHVFVTFPPAWAAWAVVGLALRGPAQAAATREGRVAGRRSAVRVGDDAR